MKPSLPPHSVEDLEDNLLELMRRAHRKHHIESESYGFIDYLLHEYTSTIRGNNCRITPNPQAFLAARHSALLKLWGLPDFGVYIDYNEALGMEYILKSLWEVKIPLGTALHSPEAFLHAQRTFYDNFIQINRYATLMLNQFPDLNSVFVFLSCGNYFSLLEFSRNTSGLGLIDKEDTKKYLSKSKRSSFEKLPDETLREDILSRVDELESVSLQLLKPHLHFFCSLIIHTPSPRTGNPNPDEAGDQAGNGAAQHANPDDAANQQATNSPRAGSLTSEIREALRRAMEHEDLKIQPSYFDPPPPPNHVNQNQANTTQAPGAHANLHQAPPQVQTQVVNHIAEARNRTLGRIRAELDHLIDESKKKDGPSPQYSEYLASRMANSNDETRYSTPTPQGMPGSRHNLRTADANNQEVFGIQIGNIDSP
ncbi:hypothetical protein ABKN59_011267 [Abortiporus biennis]